MPKAHELHIQSVIGNQRKGTKDRIVDPYVAIAEYATAQARQQNRP